MYGWIWRHLPGPTAVKLVLALLLTAVILWLLFEHVFPWVDPRLPFNKVAPEGTVD
jgi:hypothetical protein